MMEPGNRANQAQAKPVAGRIAACIKPDEAVGNAVQIGRWNTRAAVDNGHAGEGSGLDKRQPDHRILVSVALGIFQQVDDRLGEKFAVTIEDNVGFRRP